MTADLSSKFALSAPIAHKASHWHQHGPAMEDKWLSVQHLCGASFSLLGGLFGLSGKDLHGVHYTGIIFLLSSAFSLSLR
jgi:hypothetical protein